MTRLRQIAALLLCLIACGRPALAVDSGREEMLLFYANDVQGETEPCGCQANQFGGLSRKAAQIEALSAQSGLPHLFLDAGNLLFKQDHLLPGQEEQEKMAAAAIAQAYGLMGVRAIGVGSRDLAAGPAFLKSLAQKTGLPWLSANLVEADGGAPIFPPSLRIAAGKTTATVIALTGPTTLTTDSTATLLPWEAVLPGLLDKSRSSSDLVVLLSNLPEAENQKIAERYPDIHLLLHSRSVTGFLSPQPVNNTVMASTKPLGKELGILTIDWQANKRWGCPPAETLASKQAALDALLWQLDKYRKGGQDPESSLRDQPERLAGYRALAAKETALRAEIEQLRSCVPSEQPQADSAPATYTNRFLTIDTSLPENPKVAAITAQLDRELNELGRRQAKANAASDSSPYLGSAACGPCHAQQLANWQRTRHAGAYTTLTNKDQHFNLSCLPCHVTGVSPSQPGEALSLPESRRGVGCETCHGPGRAHAQQPTTTMQRRPPAAVCQACHTPPHDETFDYETRSKRVH